MTITTNPTRSELLNRKAEINNELRSFRNKLDKPGATVSQADTTRIDDLIAERDRVAVALEQRQPSPGQFREVQVGQSPAQSVTGQPRPHPLAYTSDALDAIQEALVGRTAGRFAASMEKEQRAALVTTTFGAPRVWGSNILDGPRLLHVAAGVPQQPSDAVLAQHPVFTIPAASASVGENVSLAEYASSTAGSVTLARFGRWTDLSRESLIGTDAGSIVAMHTLGVARDLDKVLIDAVETAAGSATAFSTPVVDAIRKAQAQVVDNTAAADTSDLVILVNPDNVALLESVAPIGGQTIAEGFTRFSGSLVYPSSAVNTAFITVANLRAGARFFEAQALVTESDIAVKTGTQTIATSVIAGYGLTMNGGITGAYVMVDVVTP